MQHGAAKKELAMLILTRRVGETLMIGDEVTVTVLGVKGNQVRIGVNAPKEVAVHREEIYNQIKRSIDAGTYVPSTNSGNSSGMLVITRRIGETLMIGDEVTVTVLDVKGNQVRLGTQAPKEVAVHREEIYDRIKREDEERERQRQNQNAENPESGDSEEEGDPLERG